MNYKRVFCFGCSCTYYEWPTWADILRKDLDIPVQNWGIANLGNVGILNRMVQCDISNKFTDKDLIIVLWTSWTREDRYIEGKWTRCGNIFAQPSDSPYDSDFIKKYWGWSNDIIKNSTAIISANKMFNIFGNFSITPMNSLDDIKIGDGETQKEINENKLTEFYLEDFPNIKLFNKPKSKIYDLAWENHPDIIAHSNFVKDEIYSKLGIVMKPTTEKDIQSYQDALLDELIKKTDSTDRTKKIEYLIMQDIAKSLWESNNWKKIDEHDWWRNLKNWEDLAKKSFWSKKSKDMTKIIKKSRREDP